MLRPIGGDRPFFQKSKNFPEVIAHRGGGGQWPEETIFAFEQSLKIGVDVLEMDVHKTADDVLVLMHNKTIDQTTDGTGLIAELKYDEIKELDAAARWPALRGTGIRVPSLREVFETFQSRDVRMNIEIKQKEPSLVAHFGKLIRDYEMTERVLVASGWNSVLHEFRRECPEVATSASVLEIAEFQALSRIFDWDYRPNTDAIQWHSKLILPVITQRFVDKAHSLNLKVHAWTVNEPQEMERMRALGVDGIITDYPQTLLQLLGRL
ncbi:MAG: glycerophosphoryl diester phosphodiesterase [Acidobacteriota bacterium]|jgi:glycerophosphoryl diester phosphodiesterase|nr:glycerophosphoryl diester phosphodiesterase [Acidobacteriota bacterium]